MAKSRRKRTPKTVLKLPDLEHSKSAVLNSLTSASSKRSYDHAIREFTQFEDYVFSVRGPGQSMHGVGRTPGSLLREIFLCFGQFRPLRVSVAAQSHELSVVGARLFQIPRALRSFCGAVDSAVSIACRLQ
jgi:hypothetical protein